MIVKVYVEACRPESDEEKKVGIKIEHEHLPTLKKLKSYHKENGDFPPIELMAEWIHDDHVAEFPLYYNAETGLPAMEEVLKKECKSSKTEETTEDGFETGDAGAASIRG